MTLPIAIPVEPAFRELPVLDFLGVLWPERSKDGIRELFAKGAVRFDGRPVSPHAVARECPDLQLHADPEALPAIHLSANEETSGVKLVHEDDRIAVVEKPSGVPVVPNRGRASPSCLGFLIRREMASRAGKPRSEFRRIRVVHRIDRATSGLVILARTLEAEIGLARLFEASQVHKKYIALLSGEVAPAAIGVNVPIGEGRKGRMRAGPGGKESYTEFIVLERLPGFTLVRALPRTGRTHQIRVHAWAIGHPLAVDPLYRVGPAAKTPSPPAIRRLTLHAERLVLPESWPGAREFFALLPEDMKAAIEALRGMQ